MWISKRKLADLFERVKHLERLESDLRLSLRDGDRFYPYPGESWSVKTVPSTKEVREMIKSYLDISLGKHGGNDPTPIEAIRLIMRQLGMKFVHVQGTPARWEMEGDL